MEQRELKKM